MGSVKNLSFAYVGSNQSNALFEMKVQFGISQFSGKETTAYKPLHLEIGRDGRLALKDAMTDEVLAKTSSIMGDAWLEDVTVGNRTFPIAKCYTTSSGSQHFFIPVGDLLTA